MSNSHQIPVGTHIDVDATVATFKAAILETIAGGRKQPDADQDLMRAHEIFLPATVEAYRAYLTCVRDGIRPLFCMQAAAALAGNGLQIGRENAPLFFMALSSLIAQDSAPSASFVRGNNAEPVIVAGGRA